MLVLYFGWFVLFIVSLLVEFGFGSGWLFVLRFDICFDCFVSLFVGCFSLCFLFWLWFVVRFTLGFV